MEVRNKEGRTYYEIDFVCNMASNRYYIQSALNIDTPEKNFQESRSLNSIGDNFKKTIVVKDDINAWHNEDVYKYVSKNSSMEIIRKGTDLDSDTAGTEV